MTGRHGWIIPGGKVDPMEVNNPSVSAIREAREEGGVVGKLGRCLGEFENREKGHRTKVFVMYVESLDPDMFNVARRRGSVLSGTLILLTSFSTLTAGKLVTKKESMKEPMSACLRRRKSSLVPRSQRRGSRDEVGEAGGGGGSRTGSPGNITPRSGNISRRGSVDPTSEAMEALRQFQLKSSKSYKSVSKPATENLGLALKMIKKRRSLFEHGERLENRGTSAINL